MPSILSLPIELLVKIVRAGADNSWSELDHHLRRRFLCDLSLTNSTLRPIAQAELHRFIVLTNPRVDDFLRAPASAATLLASLRRFAFFGYRRFTHVTESDQVAAIALALKAGEGLREVRLWDCAGPAIEQFASATNLRKLSLCLFSSRPPPCPFRAPTLFFAHLAEIALDKVSFPVSTFHQLISPASTPSLRRLALGVVSLDSDGEPFDAELRPCAILTNPAWQASRLSHLRLPFKSGADLQHLRYLQDSAPQRQLIIDVDLHYLALDPGLFHFKHVACTGSAGFDLGPWTDLDLSYSADMLDALYRSLIAKAAKRPSAQWIRLEEVWLDLPARIFGRGSETPETAAERFLSRVERFVFAAEAAGVKVWALPLQHVGDSLTDELERREIAKVYPDEMSRWLRGASWPGEDWRGRSFASSP
ncbi:hypothetical protein JCM10207_008866 [Rhodosporidiobolus poonsookiae]